MLDAVDASAAWPGDQQIVAASRAGTVGAFATLVDRHHAPLLRYLTRQTGDAELAADLAQETFLAAFRSLGQLTDDGSFAAWLYGIARNRLRMEWRRRRLRRVVSLDWLPSGVEAVIPALRRPDVSRSYADRDVIQRALDTLSPPLREALLLHDLGGFGGEEVARILGISPAAARKRIVRAEAAFRRAHDAEHGMDGDDHDAGI